MLLLKLHSFLIRLKYKQKAEKGPSRGININVCHSKLRPNYPTPKIPKNCTGHQIKSGNSPRSGKVREGQKSGCSPASK